MRRIVTTIVVLLLLLLVADFFLRNAAENSAARLIDKKVTEGGEPEVDLGGFPFLLSLLRGRFDRITIDIASASEGRLLMEDIHLALEDVDLEALEVLGGRGNLRAESLRGRGEISERTLNEVIAAEHPELSVDVEKGRIIVSRGAISAPANAVIALNRLILTAGDVLGPVEVPLPTLLPDVRFSSLSTEHDRLVLGVRATRLRIKT